MKFLNYIKTFILFLLTFLLGVQATCGKTEFVLPQNQVVFSVEQSQSFQSLEKELQPNIGFLKEKSKFVAVQGVSDQNQYNFSESKWRHLAEGVGDLTAYVNVLMNKNIRTAILNIQESRTVAQKYFNRINQNPSNYLSDYTLHLDDFETWYIIINKDTHYSLSW